MIILIFNAGDPAKDLEHERQFQQSTFIVPEVIKRFLVEFQRYINEGNLYEIQRAYENE